MQRAEQTARKYSRRLLYYRQYLHPETVNRVKSSASGMIRTCEYLLTGGPSSISHTRELTTRHTEVGLPIVTSVFPVDSTHGSSARGGVEGTGYREETVGEGGVTEIAAKVVKSGKIYRVTGLDVL